MGGDALGVLVASMTALLFSSRLLLVSEITLETQFLAYQHHHHLKKYKTTSNE